MAEIFDWQGSSGKMYRYEVYSINTVFNNVQGNYIFAKRAGYGSWEAVYVGETSNLAERLERHEKRLCAHNNGATHIHAHANAIEQDRRSEEGDLISMYQPVCNKGWS